MNWVDLVIIIVVILFAIEGQRRGFFVQVFDIIGFLVSLVVSLTLYPQAAQLLIYYFNLPKIAANPTGFLLIWVVTESIFFTIASRFFNRFLARYATILINR